MAVASRHRFQDLKIDPSLKAPGLTDGLEVGVTVLKVPRPTKRLFATGGCGNLQVPRLTNGPFARGGCHSTNGSRTYVQMD